MSMKLVDYVIATLIVGLFISIFGFAYYNIGTTYSVETPDNSTFESYSKINETITQYQAIDSQANDNTGTDNTIFDIVGDFFSKGYQAVKLTKASADLLTDISTEAVEDSGVGDTGNTFLQYFFGILLVIFVLALLAVLVNREF